jgi:probable HAF family extracellular repeat protein
MSQNPIARSPPTQLTTPTQLTNQTEGYKTVTRFLSLHRVGLLAALLFVDMGSALHAQTQYSVTDVGSLSGSETFGFAVNARGQVVGWSFGEGDLGERAFRTAPNQPINPATDDLGALNLFDTPSNAYGINIWADVVGVSYGDLINHAFRTAPNRRINPATDDLGTFGGPQNEPFQFSEAFGINIWGQVAGAASYIGFAQNGISFRPQHAFRTAPNRPINPATDDLGTFGGANSNAYGINDWAQVVGSAYLSDDTTFHAFRTGPNRSIDPATDDLGTLGGTQSEADGINDWGQVVGYAQLSGDTTWHAFRTGPNRPINSATDDLGTLDGTDQSEALGINNRGEVVGYSYTSGDTIERAFLFRGGVMHDLNDLIPANSGVVLEEAAGINDAGQIVAIGGGHTFLLTPARR